MNLKVKIINAIRTNKLNPEITGSRKWYNYFIVVTKLIWARNNYDGYKIEIFTNEYGEHLETITV